MDCILNFKLATKTFTKSYGLCWYVERVHLWSFRLHLLSQTLMTFCLIKHSMLPALTMLPAIIKFTWLSCLQ